MPRGISAKADDGDRGVRPCLTPIPRDDVNLKTARFRAALVLYPGCGPKALLSERCRADAPVWAFLGADDEEVSPTVCEKVLRQASGGPIAVTVYPGATHDFDDPGAARQAVAGNRTAKDDAMTRAAAQFDAVPAR